MDKMEKADFVVAEAIPEGCDYLIAGKRYPFRRADENSGFIVDEEGRTECFILLDGCAHLDGHAWQVLNGDSDE